jgi:hypothetical protein
MIGDGGPTYVLSATAVEALMGPFLANELAALLRSTPRRIDPPDDHSCPHRKSLLARQYSGPVLCRRQNFDRHAAYVVVASVAGG